MALDLPIVCRKSLDRKKVRKGALVDGRGSGCQIQQLVIESGGGLWPIVEEP